LKDNENDTEKETDNLLNKNKKKFTYISLYGEHGLPYLSKREILNDENVEDVFYSYQQELFENIMNSYKINNFCRIFISGNPGQGKSYFNYLMAKKLNCFLCDNFDPTEAGSSLSFVYNKIKPTSTKPLILVFDEVDILIEKIHKKTIQPHKKLKIEIYDKMTWNNFLDKFNYKLFPNTILVLISNKTKEYIDKIYDNSFLRNGRIDIYKHW
jgi:hypothetical protein